MRRIQTYRRQDRHQLLVKITLQPMLLGHGPIAPPDKMYVFQCQGRQHNIIEYAVLLGNQLMRDNGNSIKLFPCR